LIVLLLLGAAPSLSSAAELVEPPQVSQAVVDEVPDDASGGSAGSDAELADGIDETPGVTETQAPTPTEAQEADEASAPVRAPVPPPPGVRFGEALSGDRLRIGYSFERIQSQGLMVGTREISAEYAREVRGFSQTPRWLHVTVHTLQIAYAPHPRVTLLTEIPFLQKELQRVDAESRRRQDQTDGVGDVTFAVIVPFIQKGAESTQVHFAVTAPTGSIRRSEDSVRLPYDSQIGSVSWTLEWGWTYKGELDRVSWGGQIVGRHPVNRNGLKYRNGSRFTGSIWGGVRLFAGLSTSLRAEWEKQNNINGFDRSFMPDEDPSQNAKLRGGNRITLAPGLSLDLPKLKGQRIAVEVALPVFQKLDGPQLERDWSVKTAWQWVF
jgi:hypothetical protein